MNTKVIITVDTEPDNMWDLHSRKNPQFKNIAQLSRLQRLFERFDAKATYLTTYSVIKSDVVSALKEILDCGDCEIGTHLHALETPPFEPQLKGDGSYLHQYASCVQREKLATLDNLITESFGQKPVSYRGGRWSVDEQAVSLLAEYKYLVDSSVTPGISWENMGGLNFKKWPQQDYFLSRESCEILELPTSIRIKANLAPLAKFLYLNAPNWAHAEGILRRLANFKIIWLDPSFNGDEEMGWLCEVLLKEKIGYLNVTFHSSCIIPGGSPYTMDEESRRRFFARLERLLDYLLKIKGLESLTLKEFYHYRKSSQ